jgi:hypothetical protein
MLDWYSIFKFLHVAFAIIWLGGGLLMVILGIKADRARNDAELVGVVHQVAWCADRIYVPASIATLIFGVVAAFLGNWWGHLWVWLGLAGIASTIFLGVVVLTPRSKIVKAENGVTPKAVAISREILTIAKFDMTVLFVIVADMVLKPQLGDWITLLIFVLVIAAAGYVFLVPMFRPKTAAA